MNKHTVKIQDNSAKIRTNENLIEQNKIAIEELRKSYVPYEVLESTIARYDKIVHRLIAVLCGVVALLFICNAVWLYAWEKIDFGTNITQSGETNQIGGE